MNPTFGVKLGLKRHNQSSVMCSPALGDALRSWNQSESPKRSRRFALHNTFFHPANSRHGCSVKISKRRVNTGSRVGACVAHRVFLLWEMPRAAAGTSPGGPGDRIWRPEQPSQFSSRDYPATPAKDSGFCSGRQNRSPGPPGLIPAALGISQSRKTRWETQAPTRAPVFTRRFDLFTEQPRREFAG